MDNKSQYRDSYASANMSHVNSRSSEKQEPSCTKALENEQDVTCRVLPDSMQQNHDKICPSRNFERVLRKTEDGSSIGLVHRPRKSRPDIFSKLDQLDPASGPIYSLKERLNQKVKVLIRRRRKVNYISRVIEYKGTLTMFDKHMNLVLSDVIESFIYSLNDKVMKRARHRNNILIRGDNIILVSR